VETQKAPLCKPAIQPETKVRANLRKTGRKKWRDCGEKKEDRVAPQLAVTSGVCVQNAWA
jgi:hypothetical protein